MRRPKLSLFLWNCNMRSSRPLIPRAEGTSAALHEVSAARAASRVAPHLHEVVRFHRAGQFVVAPDQWRGRFRRRVHGAFTQNHRRQIGLVEAGKFNLIQGVLAPPLSREHIVQLPAITADDGLNFAMHAAIRATRDFYAVLALRTFEEVRFAHELEILNHAGDFKPPFPPVRNTVHWINITNKTRNTNRRRPITRLLALATPA